MTIQLNGKAYALDEEISLTALLARLAPRKPFAVAHNGQFVPRSQYEAHRIAANDQIEIVQPSVGG
jgi:sulfur carrier protein